MSDRSVDQDPLSEILRAGLTEPDTVSAAGLDLLRSALECGARDGSRAELALAALAAVLYSRPDLVPDDLLDPAVELLCTGAPPERLVRNWCRVWSFLAASPAAPRAWALLGHVLRDERVDEAIRGQLVPVVGAFVQWREDLVGLDAVLALATCPLLKPHHAALLDHGVERFVFCTPEDFTPDRLGRLAEAFQDLPRYKYVLYALAGRHGLPAACRSSVRGRLRGLFPFQRAAAAILMRGPIRLLVVLNTGMGQGDDLVRLVPLLQALLDANPVLTITLVTRRTYLYDNPRVTLVAIDDDAAVRAMLLESFEGVLEFFQPEWSQLTYRVELHASLAQLLASQPSALLVQGDLGRVATGRAGKRSQFMYQQVALDGRDIAALRGLDRPELPSIYDPGNRLIAELGLPQRAAEEQPRTPSLLIGVRSSDAERVWAELLPPGGGPVALVNPFGGSGAIKGFVRQETLLAAELAGLVSEGYRLVVLTQDQEWARPAAIEATLAHLGPENRARIRMAPDPADTDAVARLALTERSALPAKDRVVRLFKYFASYAELIVTVEGWLAHLAYQLGRPFRLFLAAGSYTPDWFPHGRGLSQRLVPALSPRAASAHSRSALLGPTAPPSAPHFPRKTLLEVALAGLGRWGSVKDAAPLRHAVASLDGAVRTWAVAALGQLGPHAYKADLLGALQDRWPAVVRESAVSLLQGDVDCGRELGPAYRMLLEAYVDGTRENWDAVTRIGPSVLPVLFHLARTEQFDVHWGATLALRQMLAPWVPLPDERSP